MVRFVIILFFVLILLGGAGFAYVLFYNSSLTVPSQTEEIEAPEPEEIPDQPLYLVKIPSFKVPILHNKVAVKILVFHVVLNMESLGGQQIADASVGFLLDMYIRYLVAHYEVNVVEDRVNVPRIAGIIKNATQEVLGPRYPVAQVIIQGVYAGDGSQELSRNN